MPQKKVGPAPKQKWPFQPKSLIGRSLELCQEGTTETKLRALVQSFGGNYAVLLRRLRSGQVNMSDKYRQSVTWVFEQSGEKIRIYDLEVHKRTKE